MFEQQKGTSRKESAFLLLVLRARSSALTLQRVAVSETTLDKFFLNTNDLADRL